MTNPIPPGARPAARVLLLSDQGRLLLLHAQDSDGRRWWVAPGGGLSAGETFEAAAQRELAEETGLVLPVGAIGPWVWVRRHMYPWNGKQLDQYERFFVARTAEERMAPSKPDSYIVGHRWWSLGEIEQSSEVFAPRRLARLLPPILRGQYPSPAIDCGV